MSLCKSNGRVMNILAGVLEESKCGLFISHSQMFVSLIVWSVF